VRTRARDLLAPLIGLPLVIPLIIGAARASAPLLGGAGAIGLDQQDAEVSLVAVRPGKLVFEHRTHETIVEESGGAVDDVQRLRLRVIGFDAAGRTEHSTVGQG